MHGAAGQSMCRAVPCRELTRVKKCPLMAREGASVAGTCQEQTRIPRQKHSDLAKERVFGCHDYTPVMSWDLKIVTR